MADHRVQASLFHPACGAVSLGLLHGSQSDVVVVCGEPGRTELLGPPVADPIRGGAAFDRLVDSCLGWPGPAHPRVARC